MPSTFPSPLLIIRAYTDSNGSLEKASTSSPRIHPPRILSNLLLSLSANLRQLIVDNSLRAHNPATPTSSRPCNRPRCKTCPIHPRASSCTNLTYPITTHAGCKSMNLIYQLQCNVLKLNPWRYSSGEPRPTEAVAAIRQYRGPCG